ncbi:MAG: hypothetical protein COA49_09790 [Bacteroidetes bacterium]|nr:MAG: hypothetical protein COA49_09790 [Bacteroidota bacterium]
MKNILLSFLTIAATTAFTNTSQAQTEICPGATVIIETGDLYFAPSAIEIPVGTTVGWVNVGGTHNANGDISVLTNASFGNPEPFFFPLISGSKGGVCIGTFTFTLEGVYNYDCTGYGHAAGGMVASLTVVGGGEVAGCTDTLACNYNVDATTDDGSCALPGDACDDGDSVTINDIYDDECNCAGIIDNVGDVSQENSFKIFPNPASSFVRIQNPSNEVVSIFNVVGSKVYSSTTSKVDFTIDVSAYSKGIYTVFVGGQSSKLIIE